jgi:hypothetical protein
MKVNEYGKLFLEELPDKSDDLISCLNPNSLVHK